MSPASIEERLAHRLRIIESLERHSGEGRLDLALPGSELAEDEAQLGSHQTSHLVGHCLAVSLDTLMTARFILTDPATGGIRLPVVSQYAVLRSAIESASLAVRLLMPDDRRTRLTRSLQATMEDVLRDDALVTTFTESLLCGG